MKVTLLLDSLGGMVSVLDSTIAAINSEDAKHFFLGGREGSSPGFSFALFGSFYTVSF